MDKKLLQEVLETALAQGGDFADIFVERKKVTGIGMEAGRIERVQSGYEAGAGIRVLCGESTAYGYTNDLSKKGLMEAAKLVSHAARGGRKEYSLDLTKLTPVVDFEFKKRPEDVATGDKVEVVKKAEKAARSVDNQKIKQVITGYGDSVQQVIIANSNGDYVEDERVRTRLMVNAVAADGGTIQTGYDAVGGMCGFELFDRVDPEEFAKNAAGRAVKMLDAKPAPTGNMPCVMAGEAGGTMVHEACGHGLEADLVQRELSVYAGKKGEQVASELVTVIDDATMPDKYGSYRFDDEGVSSRPVELIKNGVLNDFLYDRLTAAKEGRKPNGHGRRQSYQEKPIPRMANTYIAPGKTDPEKIIKETKKGLLVKKMGGGQVNTTTGDFVFDVAEGYLIQDGEIGPLVRGATLTGNGPEVLKIVDMVGSDLGFAIGTCGKDGQGVPVSDAQPTMSIRQLLVGGTSEPIAPNGKIKRYTSDKPISKNKIRRL
ncbi:TldD protein [Desulfohalotomaculum tongense]|uniref:TldD/PmbA family protein n=1 Tax=Desulforadius tongensis TaxID=1216062 RepID=UPI001956A00C|nr:TldD/PmbA family protein [Desulforadius tongensis]MBM7854511.1 TldD protein [Desulforadius tongensis]